MMQTELDAVRTRMIPKLHFTQSTSILINNLNQLSKERLHWKISTNKGKSRILSFIFGVRVHVQYNHCKEVDAKRHFINTLKVHMPLLFMDHYNHH